MVLDRRRSRPRYSSPTSAAQAGVEQLLEDVRRARSRRRRRSAPARRRGSKPRGSWPRAERVRRAGATSRSRRVARASRAAGRSISTRPPRSSIRSRSASNSGSQRAARVAEQLLARLAPSIWRRSGQLAPQPGHRDLVGAVAELAAQQRPPDRAPTACRPIARVDPVARGHRTRTRSTSAPPRCSRRTASPMRSRASERQRPEAQQVERRRERRLSARRRRTRRSTGCHSSASGIPSSS